MYIVIVFIIFIYHVFFPNIIYIWNCICYFKMNEKYVHFANCATTHIILWDKRCFFNLTLANVNVRTILSITNLIKGSERAANVMLPNKTRFHIYDTLYSSKFRKNLLSFKYISRNGHPSEIMEGDNVKHLYITSIKLSAFSSRLYHITIKPIKSYVVVN